MTMGGALTFGIPRRWLAVTASTNDAARDWALAGAPQGALVVAGKQTRGRGQQGKPWSSPRGKGLYASVVLRPDWSAERAADLTILAGMAAYGALRELGVPELSVKRPNDILSGGKKLAGVLVESRVGRGGIDFAIAGIGINVAQTMEELPADVRESATSLALVGARVSVDQVLDRLLASWSAVVNMPLAALREGWSAAGAREKEARQ